MKWSREQGRVGARLKELADTYGAKQGLDRRQFLKTSSGMAAAFLAMNSVYGNVFNVSEAEAADAVMASERAQSLQGQFVFDVNTHFVRDDYSQESFLDFLQTTATDWKTGVDPNRVGLHHLKFENYVRQIYLNSDTDVAVLSDLPWCPRCPPPPPWCPPCPPPVPIPHSWDFLNNAQVAEAAKMVNTTAGSTRMLGHSMVTPGQPGWMEEVDALSRSGHYSGWTLPKHTTSLYWLDDEKIMYSFYGKAVTSGIRNIGIPSWTGVWETQTPRDLVKAAEDWPQLNFIIYGGGFRGWWDRPTEVLADFESTGRIEWCSDLAEVPAQNGASNIYAEMGTTFASTAIVNPRLTAAILGTLIKGLSASNVLWGTGSVLYGLPQWQIEAFRRLEIPEDMQEKHGFAPMGGADSAVKQQIFGLNAARLYNLDLRANYGRLSEDKFAQIKRGYD